MQKLILGLFVLFPGLVTLTPGCKKGHPLMSEGVIVGWNYGSCATCGGFYLNMSNDTVRDSSTYYVLGYPEGLNPIINQYFTQYQKNHAPIYVSFDWQPASLNIPYAAANWIEVTAIQSR